MLYASRDKGGFLTGELLADDAPLIEGPGLVLPDAGVRGRGDGRCGPRIPLRAGVGTTMSRHFVYASTNIRTSC